MLCTIACQALLSMGSPGHSTGEGCHSLLQGIFPTQGWNPDLLNCLQILYHLSHNGSPSGEGWWAPFIVLAWSWGRHSPTIRNHLWFLIRIRKQAHGFSFGGRIRKQHMNSVPSLSPCKLSISIYIYQTFQIWDCTLDPKTPATPFLSLTTLTFYPFL